MDVLFRICNVLDCDIEKIMEHIRIQSEFNVENND